MNIKINFTNLKKKVINKKKVVKKIHLNIKKNFDKNLIKKRKVIKNI